MTSELVTIESSELSVELIPAMGARFHRIRAFGRDLMRTPDDPSAHRDDPFFWGGYVMAPWCNRIETVPTEVAGRTLVPETNFPDGTAIHGLVYVAPWEQVGDGRFRIDLDPAPRWPWRFAVEADVRVTGPVLEVTLSVLNLDDGPMPAGVGLHPWFLSPFDLVIPAETVHRANFGSGTEPSPVEGDEIHDRRAPGPLAVGADATWADLTEPHLSLRWPDAAMTATIDLGPTSDFVVAANIAGYPAVALEPQTHGPDPIRRLLAGEPGAPALLDPGQRLDLDFSITVDREDR